MARRGRQTVRTSGAAAGPEDDTPWLSPDELAAWLGLVRVTAHLPAALDRRLQRVAGLTQFEYFVLARLSESPTRSLRMSDLAGITEASNARLSHVAGRLEARGLLERRARENDRRTVDAVLTDAGHAVLVDAAPDHVRHVRGLVVDALTPAELHQLRVICERVLERVEAERQADGR